MTVKNDNQAIGMRGLASMPPDIVYATTPEPQQYCFSNPKFPPYPDWSVAKFFRDLKSDISIVRVAEELAWILGERLHEQPTGKPESIWRILYGIRISDLPEIELECRSSGEIRREFQQRWFGNETAST